MQQSNSKYNLRWKKPHLQLSKKRKIGRCIPVRHLTITFQQSSSNPAVPGTDAVPQYAP
jgi:hypothetical protein